MKKSFLTLIASLALASTMFAAAACTGNTDNPGGDDSGDNPPPVTQDTYDITIGGGGSSRALTVGESATVSWTVTRNDVTVTDEPVTVTVSDDAIISWDDEANTVTALAEGSATLTVTLDNHTDVSASVTYNVTDEADYFFSRDIQRGNVNLNNEESGSVSILGGQATIVAKDAGTQYVFRATITIPSSVTVGTSQSFGIGSFVNNGDNALWFGLRNDDGANDGLYSVYQRNFYNGWGSATTDGIVNGYESCDVGSEIEFEIVRDGKNYYYSIGGYYGSYTDNTGYEEATYPGIYSQEIAFNVTDFSVTYDAEEVAEVAAGYADKGVAAVVINETTSRLLRGETYQFTVTTYPETEGDETITWSLDKTGMTAGADGTTVSSTGALTLAADAEGTVTLIAACGDRSDSLEITILTVSDDDENDQLTVSGGVVLNDDGSITFPESMINVDGVVDETDYADADYSAVLKQEVTTDFSIEFTVSGYQTTAEYPKLQIALGEGSNNFYVVYKPDGTCRIEAYAGGVFTNGTYSHGWFNSNSFTNFDPTEEHTFCIPVAEDGTYTVMVDETELTFNMDGNEAILKRDYNAFSTEQPVKIATKGVAATVSNIKVTNGGAIDYPAFWSYNSNTTDITENGFTMRLTSLGWQTRDNYGNRIISTTALPADFAMEFDLEFSEANDDSKFVIRIGNWEYHINNKLTTGVLEGSIYKGAFGANITVPDATLSVHVRLERQGDAVRFIINDTVIEDVTSGADTSTLLEFYAYNANADYTNETATVSNLEIGEYSRADIGQESDWTYSDNGNITNVTENGFTLRADDDGWNNGDQNINKITATAAYAGDIEIEFDLAFSAAMTDGKFIIELGGQRVMINNINGMITANIINYDRDKEEIAGALYSGLKVRIVRIGENISLYVNDSADPVRTGTGTVGNTSVLFFLFNSTAEDADATVTVSNLTISAYESEEDWLYTDNGNVTNVTETGFTIRANDQGWANEEQSLNEVTSVAAFEGDAELSFDLAFSGNMSDGKFVVMIGGTRVMINNKLGAGGNISVTVNKSGEDWSESDAGIDGLSMNVRIVRVGTVLEVYINDVLKKTASCEATTSLSFFVFNQAAEDAEVTATVSDLTMGAYEPEETWSYVDNGNITNVTDNGFTLRADDDGWNNGDNNVNKITATEAYEGDIEIEFTLSFSGTMGDGKFIIELGGQRVMINNKNGAISSNIIDFNEAASDDASYTGLKVRIVRAGDTISLYINDGTEPVRTNSGTASNSSVSFWLFNSSADDVDVTATVSNLTITAVEASAQ